MCRVSVIIPTYNSPRFLIEALESVINQTYRDLEVIIVDDGSTDNTPVVLLPYLEKHKNIRCIYQENKGTAAARNTGIKSSSGEYIAFLDHDDIWLPLKSELQVRVLDENPLVGLVYCRFHYFYEGEGILAESHDREWRRGELFEQFLERNYIPTASLVMVRRSCFDKAGDFDESLSIVDDYDFYIRIARNYKIEYVDRSLVYWRRHVHSASKVTEKLIHNRIAMREKILKNQILNDWQRSIVSQLLKRDYFALGYFLLSSYQEKKASKFFRKSLGHKPLLSMIYLICSYLPVSVYKFIRKCKSALLVSIESLVSI